MRVFVESEMTRFMSPPPYGRSHPVQTANDEEDAASHHQRADEHHKDGRWGVANK